jgi:uncharacterized protein YjbJ (UPF0337 family)
MNSITDKNWTDLKAKIRNKWGKFSDQELNTMKGDFTLLRGSLQRAYGLSKENAEFQYEAFKTAVFTLIGKETARPAVARAAAPAEAPVAAPVVAPVAALALAPVAALAVAPVATLAVAQAPMVTVEPDPSKTSQAV